MQTDSSLKMQIREVLERFNNLVTTRNMQILEEFFPSEQVLLVGSDSGEIAKGSRELEAFFTRIFSRETTFSWEWERLDVAQAGEAAWFFAEGCVILNSDNERRKNPYRVSGVLRQQENRWLWEQYHGSEPVSGK